MCVCVYVCESHVQTDRGRERDRVHDVEKQGNDLILHQTLACDHSLSNIGFHLVSLIAILTVAFGLFSKQNCRDYSHLEI